MKWFLVIVLICVIMLIAHAVSQQYKDKFDFYYNLNNFLNQFKMNVSFKKEEIEDFLNNLNYKKQFKILINRYKDYLTTNNLNFDDLDLLESEEKVTLSEILKSLGKYDAENEINQVNNFILLINEKLNKAKEEKQKLCPMILKLSLLFAIGVAIILI